MIFQSHVKAQVFPQDIGGIRGRQEVELTATPQVMRKVISDSAGMRVHPKPSADKTKTTLRLGMPSRQTRLDIEIASAKILVPFRSLMCCPVPMPQHGNFTINFVYNGL